MISVLICTRTWTLEENASAEIYQSSLKTHVIRVLQQR